jgi:uncharacterized protein
METHLLLIILLFIVAILYSSVGHGGASGYLALMVIFGVVPEVMRSSALILNLFVAGTSFVSFYRAGFFRSKLFWPFALTSIPASFAGAWIQIYPAIYKTLLGAFLVIAVIRMIVKTKDNPEENKPIPTGIALGTGTIIGLFSGMIGIGGGIILSPVLVLFKWANAKQAACVSALFIFVNSASGLASLLSQGTLPAGVPYTTWVSVAFAGGLLGSFLGSKKFSFAGVTYALAGVLCFAIVKLVV